MNRLRKIYPVNSIALELVKFDMQLLENPEITGIEYQQGTLHGYEVREYLLEKHKRKCAYCGKGDVKFEVDHIMPKALGGHESHWQPHACVSFLQQQKGQHASPPD